MRMYKNGRRQPNSRSLPLAWMYTAKRCALRLLLPDLAIFLTVSSSFGGVVGNLA
jgi:hypothetical protein